MTALNVLDDVQPTEKVYSNTMVSMAAFFCGPLAAGYFFIENYKALGQHEKVTKAWVITIVSTLFLFGLGIFLSEVVDVPTIGFSFASLYAAKSIYKKEQEQAVLEHIEQGGQWHSAWRATGISLLILTILMTIVFGVAYFFVSDLDVPAEREWIETPVEVEENATEGIESKTYGDAPHVVVYNRNNVREDQVDAIAEELISVDFFGNNNQKFVYIDRSGDNYLFSIEDPAADPNSAATKALYTQMAARLRLYLVRGQVSVQLMDENLEEVLGTF